MLGALSDEDVEHAARGADDQQPVEYAEPQRQLDDCVTARVLHQPGRHGGGATEALPDEVALQCAELQRQLDEANAALRKRADEDADIERRLAGLRHQRRGPPPLHPHHARAWRRDCVTARVLHQPGRHGGGATEALPDEVALQCAKQLATAALRQLADAQASPSPDPNPNPHPHPNPKPQTQTLNPNPNPNPNPGSGHAFRDARSGGHPTADPRLLQPREQGRGIPGGCTAAALPGASP